MPSTCLSPRRIRSPHGFSCALTIYLYLYYLWMPNLPCNFNKMSAQAVKYANDFITFLNNSPTPYHAVDSVKAKLVESGFMELSERVNWAGKVKKNGAYFVTRNNSSIIAFTVGGHWQPGNGVSIVGAHTDSPTLRIKPISHSTKEGFNQVGIETYGGGLWHTWFDRDLGIAGRVFIEEEESGNIVSKLVKVDKPVLRIPTLAIHLTKERAKFEFNKETQFYPISSLVDSAEKGKEEKKAEGEEHNSCAGEELTTEEFKSIQSVVERHNKQLLDLVAADAGCTVSQIVDFELVLFDHNKSTLGGLNEEFVFSGRLDNLTSCFCATEALVNASKDANRLGQDTTIQLISLFDHEEIGSVSAQGADSSFLPDILQRITRLTGNEVATDLEGQPNSFFLESMAKSFLLSSDMAHGVHPNYGEVYEKLNRPRINEGPVIKINANQRYSTNSAGIVLLKKIAEMGKVPLQLFVVRNDSPCGSTIGPMLSAKLGIRTLDLGNPQLSMHSIRETGGARDVQKLADLFESYFMNYSALEDKIKV